MGQDRITNIHIAGYKAIEEADIPLSSGPARPALKVLIGENGSGKSSILEALAIISSAARQATHVTEVIERGYGRVSSLLRRGSDSFRFELTVQGEGPALRYGFAVGLAGTEPTIVDEWLCEGLADLDQSEKSLVLSRSNTQVRFRTSRHEWDTMSVGEQALAAPFVGAGASAGLRRMLLALGRIEVHPPFEVRPIWQQKELKISEGPRWPAAVEPVERLSRYGENLASAFQQLRNLGGEVWDRVLMNTRLGLGEDLRDIRLQATGRGNIELELAFSAFPEQVISADLLSEGQLSYLGFIALCELGRYRSILAVDEPELHLHPALLARVVSMLEEVARECPVLLATHSDRLLDALDEPEHSVLLCSLDENRAMQMTEPDPVKLQEWLTNYAGLGQIRAEGYESHVFAQPAPAKRSAKP
jgi:predicted ATPase